MKRVQASTGTLDNMAAAHAIAPIRRMIFIALAPDPKWRAVTSTNASSSIAPCPTYHLARLRVWIESLSGFEGVAGELRARLLLHQPIASALRVPRYQPTSPRAPNPANRSAQVEGSGAPTWTVNVSASGPVPQLQT